MKKISHDKGEEVIAWTNQVHSLLLTWPGKIKHLVIIHFLSFLISNFRFGTVGGDTIAIQDGGLKEDCKVEGKDAVESLTTADLGSSTKNSASNVSQRKGSSTPNDEKQNKR